MPASGNRPLIGRDDIGLPQSPEHQPGKSGHQDERGRPLRKMDDCTALHFQKSTHVGRLFAARSTTRPIGSPSTLAPDPVSGQVSRNRVVLVCDLLVMPKRYERQSLSGGYGRQDSPEVPPHCHFSATAPCLNWVYLSQNLNPPHLEGMTLS